MRRRVYFLAGFDPRGASAYYRLFAEQLQQFQVRTGRTLTLGRRRGKADPLTSRWQVNDTDQSLQLDYCFLHWDDIVRQHWPRRPLAILRSFRDCYVWYILRGGLAKIHQLCPNVALCGAYPLLFVGFWLVLTLVISLGLGHLLLSLGVATVPVQSLQLLGAIALLRLGWFLAEQRRVIWLFRSIGFTHRLGQTPLPELDERMTALARRILDLEAEEPADQVLLVGHSSGSFVMVMLAAALQRQPEYPQVRDRLQLLSLGQNLANLAVHRGASGFHRDLLQLAREPLLPWRDITSHDDYLCFAGVDPYRSCGLPEPEQYPQMDTIPLAQRLSLDGWWALINHQFQLHFEYLQTAPPDRQGGFDYLELLLSPAPATAPVTGPKS